MNSEQREKYSRQILFAGLGEEGQERVLKASAVLVGCGALGTVAANLLVRAGTGRVRIIDRDFVEMSNLQRQTLFEESDVKQALPKAVAAERRLRAINSEVSVEGIVADLTPQNTEELLSGFDVILDATDNFETRLLLNDEAVSLGVPWIYAAAVGSYGVTMTILPGETACLACLLESDEGRGILGGEATCDTAGVSERRRGRNCVDRGVGSDEIACRKARGASRQNGVLRRVERKASVNPRGAQPGLPRLRAQRFYLPRG